jgi:hypothetical protein
MTMKSKNNSRAVGHTYERQLRLEFIKLGWEKCQTSRYASREHDDANVDFVHTEPFNIQAKRWKSAPSYHEVLESMPDDTNYNIVIHKRPNKGEVVVMDKATFYALIEKLRFNGII